MTDESDIHREFSQADSDALAEIVESINGKPCPQTEIMSPPVNAKLEARLLFELKSRGPVKIMTGIEYEIASLCDPDCMPVVILWRELAPCPTLALQLIDDVEIQAVASVALPETRAR
jgi:hypothetical protein